MGSLSSLAWAMKRLATRELAAGLAALVVVYAAATLLTGGDLSSEYFVGVVIAAISFALAFLLVGAIRGGPEN